MALVFVSGALLGGLGYRAYYASTSSANPQHRPSLAEFRKRYVSDMTARVKLDDKQVVQIGKLFDEFDKEVEPVTAKRMVEDQALPCSILDTIKADVGNERTKFGLSEAQASQVDQLVDQVGQEFRQRRADRRVEDQSLQAALNDKIDAMLRPDQRPLAQQFREERKQRRERFQAEHQAEIAQRHGCPLNPPLPPQGRK